MIDWTYSPFRVLMRLIAPQALLYTEMQTCGAILNNPAKALHHHACEYPLALQLGGADPQQLALCAKMAEEQGFAEINLNLGCPSDRVQAGRFGACMMAEPQLVAECITAMKRVVSIPITAKTRIGIDQLDSYEFFADFVQHLIAAGCDKLIIHARKAWLHGLNPKQNRTIPPLHYDYVYRLKADLSSIPVVINGNITTIQEINQHRQKVDGVMLGRLVCENPYALAKIHHALFPIIPLRSRLAIMEDYQHYLNEQFHAGIPLSILFKPLLNFAHSLAGAKQWKEQLIHMQQSKQIKQLLPAIRLLGELETRSTTTI